MYVDARKFQKRFRSNKEAFNFALFQLDLISGMPTAMPPKHQVAATLLLLTGGSFKHIFGNYYLMVMC